MIELDFGDCGGGRRSFRTGERIEEYLQAHLENWKKDGVCGPALKRNDKIGQSLQRITQMWSRIISKHEEFNQQARHERELQAQISGQRPISLDSSAGQAIVAMVERGAELELTAAIAWFYARPNDYSLQSLTSDRFEAVLNFWAATKGISPPAAAASRRELQKTMAKVSADAEKHQVDWLDWWNEQSVALSHLKSEVSNQRESLDQLHEETAARSEKQYQEWKKDWETLTVKYTEQLRLRAAVKQWDDRGVEHERRFNSLKWWVIGAGSVGSVMGVIISVLALEGAEHLFAYRLGATTGTLPVGTLRPTWMHELLFAASVTVLYLTMFLWGMRILVRMLMSEQHLGVDARSRANMAHTYLALIEEDGAADEKDRAIVLASLFRPVTDGLVRDDALPLMSPASVLSGSLAGGSRS